MPDSTRDRAASLQDHPSWCDPRHCQRSGSGLVHHRSDPIRWQIDGGDAEVQACRSQFDSHAEHEPTYQLQIQRYDVVNEAVTFEWTDNDLRFLQLVLSHLGGLG